MTSPTSVPEDSSKVRDPRVYFAAERTFLAWIRTGLALMGFGFVVARFGLFLRELSMRNSHPSQMSTQTTGPSLWLGTALVVVGVLVNVSAAATHLREVKELAAGTWVPGKPSKTAVAVALLLAAAGIGLAVYLVWVR
ncbi:MAG: YidH family protein [Acidobacteriaceae bacterium]